MSFLTLRRLAGRLVGNHSILTLAQVGPKLSYIAG